MERTELESPQSLAQDPAESLSSVGAERAFVVGSLQDAVRRNDTVRARRLAERAGLHRMQAALPELRALLPLPRGLHRHTHLRQKRWASVRTAIATALGQIGDVSAIPVLTNALFDSSPAVRHAASESLIGFGEEAVLPLANQLAERHDWTLDGMSALIATLGKIQAKQASPALSRVLLGDAPQLPGRFCNNAALYAFYMTLLLMSGIWLVLIGGVDGLLPPEQWIPSLLCMLVISLFLFLPTFLVNFLFVFLPIEALRQAKEGHALAIAASDALAAVQDKRALPDVVEIAFGNKRARRRAAQRALLSLLPLLGPEDFGEFPAETLRLLTGGLTHPNPFLVLEIARALEFIGTGQAAGPMRRLARRGMNAGLRAEAERVLPVLEKRQQREQASGSLLRAAAPPAATPAELLRAAHTHAETPSEQLLRPGPSSSSA